MTVQQLIEALQTVPADLRTMRVVLKSGGHTHQLYRADQACVDGEGAMVDGPTVLQHWASTETFEVVMVLVGC